MPNKQITCLYLFKLALSLQPFIEYPSLVPLFLSFPSTFSFLELRWELCHLPLSTSPPPGSTGSGASTKAVSFPGSFSHSGCKGT